MPDNTFGARTAAALSRRGPLCVGIDPHAQLLRSWGLDDSLDGARQFCETLVAAVAGHVAFVKPQSAFFERFGSGGIALLENVIAESRRAGALVLLDVKRGDIGSTMSAYAQAYLDADSSLAVDAITASPYLGFGSLQPLFDTAQANDRGVFVLALTSNSEGGQVQLARRKDGRTVAQSIIDEAAALNAEAEPLGDIGIVMGATVPGCKESNALTLRQSTYGITHNVVHNGETAHDLSELNGPILVPGMGVQGGQPSDLRRVLGASAQWAIPSYSREIARHGPTVASVRSVAEQTAKDCADAIGR
ncbi:orotidine-5'-phosphate decarboxylase [Stackebrandtia soli]|uniref:orotidine-5'-phosphate decarboxylase n=1 Tax=Stackebrandtia soli TaxID=1892856 RepID=UPI0039EA9B48